jgi:hypothetical protein
MILYSDCVIDTTSTVFKNDAKIPNRFRNKVSNKVQKFLDFIYAKTNKPKEQEFNTIEDSSLVLNEKKYEEYYKSYSEWDLLKFNRIDKQLKNTSEFNLLLKKAVQEAYEIKISSEEFEDYVERYYSEEIALELKRNRVVVGRCSMDSSPRRHAMKIAILAAKTSNWKIFLRAHLDIMNDRFERVSDGSWSENQRQTYLEELQQLNINTLDLLLGICFRIENPSKNHYFGSPNRVGRALSDYNNKIEVENELKSIISDKSLDIYNRVLFYYVFHHYLYNLQRQEDRKRAYSKMLEAIKTLPYFLYESIEIETFDEFERKL